MSEGIPIIFSKVIKAGSTKVKVSEKGPKPPKKFSIINPYYKITTSVLYSGLVYVIIPYDENYVSSIHKLKIMIFDGKKRAWYDISYSINKKEKLLCGKAFKLSTFVLMQKD